MTNKFNVGDKVEIIASFSDTSNCSINEKYVDKIGTISTITRVVCSDAVGYAYVLANVDAYWDIKELKLVIDNEGGVTKMKKIKVEEKFSWVIIKQSCNNYTTNFNGTEKEAIDKLFSCGEGQYLYKLTTVFAKCELKVNILAKIKKKAGRLKKKVFKLAKKK